MTIEIELPPKPKRRYSHPKRVTSKFKRIDLKKVEELAGQGLSKKEICFCMDISEKTLYNRQKIDAEITVAIERGRAIGLNTVNQVLMGMIKKEDIQAINTFYKYIAPRVTVMPQNEPNNAATVINNTNNTLINVTPRTRQELINGAQEILSIADKRIEIEHGEE